MQLANLLLWVGLVKPRPISWTQVVVAAAATKRDCGESAVSPLRVVL